MIPTQESKQLQQWLYEVDFSDLGPSAWDLLYNLIKVSELIATEPQRENDCGLFSSTFMIFKIITNCKKDILWLGETKQSLLSVNKNIVVEIFKVVPSPLYQEPPCPNELGVTSVKIEMRSFS